LGQILLLLAYAVFDQHLGFESYSKHFRLLGKAPVSRGRGESLFKYIRCFKSGPACPLNPHQLVTGHESRLALPSSASTQLKYTHDGWRSESEKELGASSGSEPEESMGRRKEGVGGEEAHRPDDEGEARGAADTRVAAVTGGSGRNEADSSRGLDVLWPSCGSSRHN
jgi:hypothetical protein